MLKLAMLRVWNYCIIKIMKNKGKKWKFGLRGEQMKKIKDFFIKVGKFLWSHKIVLVISIVAILLLIISMINGIFNKKKGTEISSNQVITLEKGNVVNSINENGKVVASTNLDIFAEKELAVTEILVKVGDKVEEGDIIASLDSNSIEQEIAKKKAAAQSTSKTIGASINAAKKRLNEAIENRKNGTNASIVSAENALNQSLDAYKAAKKNYEDYKNSIDEGYNSEIVGEKNSRENLAYAEKSSKLKIDQLNRDLSESMNKSSENRGLAFDKENEAAAIQNNIDNLTRYSTELGIKMTDLQSQMRNSQGSGGNSSEEVDNSLRNQINNITREQEEVKIEISKLTEELANVKSQKEKYAQEADALDKEIKEQRKNLDQMNIDVDKARDDLKADSDKAIKSGKAREDQLKTLELNMETAKNAYEASQVALKSAEASADNEISMLRDALNSANANSNNLDEVELKYLNEELEKTKVKALKSGTITKIDAKEGEVPKTAIARIETVKDLKIESTVKEYNVNDVKIGTKVIITSDALPGENFEGKVDFINPTPEDADPNSTSKDVNYKTSIEISKEDSDKLSPGMTLRVKYILSEENDTFHVPTTAIFEREGKNYILGLKKDGKDTYEIEKIEVQKGLENDFETAIKGKNLKKSMKILSTSQGYGEGQIVNIIEVDISEIEDVNKNVENSGE